MKVPSEGQLTAKIALVGEAPGADEEKRMKPFVGPAGQLLDEMLTSIGLPRRDCLITNVVKLRPPGNEISHFINLEKKPPVLTDTYKQGVQELRAELEQSKANVIVALGNVPLYTLTGKLGITKWRGSVLESTLLPGRKVVACIHPSAALRMYLWRRLIAHDLNRSLVESHTPDIDLPNPDLYVSPTFEESCEYIEKCHKAQLVGLDIEVINRQVYCLSLAPTTYEAISIPFVRNKQEFYTEQEETEIWYRIGKLLEDHAVTKVLQNAMFDVSFLLERYGIKTAPLHDAMVAQKILFPDYPVGLDFIASTRTRYPYYKDEGKQWNKLAMDDILFGQYNAKDALICREAIEGQLDELQKTGNRDTYNRQMSLIPPLLCVQSHGIRVDHNRLNSAKQEAEVEIAKCEEELAKRIGRPINLASPKQLQQLFYIEMGLPMYRGKSGGPTTDDDALKRLARKGIVEASIIQRHRHYNKLRGTYFGMVYDEDGRFRGSINVVGTKTGRISSGKTIFGTGGNMQNQPPEMDDFFVADDECILVDIDLSQAENRIVAYLAQEETMIHAFETEQDVHSLTGALISGLSYEEVKRQHKEDIPSPLGSGDKTWRFWGKKCNHGLNYGLGYKKFSLVTELPENEGKAIHAKYHAVYPGVRNVFHALVQEQLRNGRTITNLLGRKRRFLDRWGDDLFQDAYAQIPQSTVADILWDYGVNYVYNAEIMRPVTIINIVHDSLKLQLPLSLGHVQIQHLLSLIAKTMEHPLRHKSVEFVIPCDVKMGTRMSELVKVKIDDTEKIKELVEKAEREA